MLTELRTMQADYSKSHCRYCCKPMKVGDMIAGHYGILWGHHLCVEHAVSTHTLITSSNSGRHRPLDLAKRADRFHHGRTRTVREIPKHQKGTETVSGFVDHMRKMTEKAMASMGVPAEMPGDPNSSNGAVTLANKESRKLTKYGTRTGRFSTKKRNVTTLKQPPSQCAHYAPQLMMNIEMPRDMQPTRSILQETPRKSLRKLVEETWKKLRKQRFSHYVRNTREAPICKVHGVLDVVTTAPFGQLFCRKYWWVCPWKPEDDEKKRNYNGYELI